MKLQEEIEQEVTNRLLWDSRINGADIRVEVNDSDVILSGAVNSFWAKEIVEMDVWSVNGVKSVHNALAIRLPKNYLSRQKMERYILSLLKWNSPIEITDLKIQTEDEYILLKGSVPYLWQKYQVENILSQQVSGIPKIINELIIVPTKKVTDQTIASEITKVLEIYQINLKSVQITVENGTVFLTGEVRTQKEYERIKKAAQSTLGVTDVESHITILK